MQDLATLVQAHEDIYGSFTRLVQGLGAGDWARATGCPGWRVRDQVAHVASLEGLLAGDPYPDDHELPADLPHVRDDVGRFMEILVDVRRHRTTDELVVELEDVFTRRRRQLRSLEDLSEEGPSLLGGTQPLYRSLPIRVMDLYAHEQDVRRAVGRSGHTVGAAPSLVLERIGEGLAAVLPGRVDGTGVVRFELVDDPARSHDVVLSDPAGPAVRIPLTVEQYVALGCGRSDAPTVDDLAVEGDREVAAQVLGACGLTP